MLYAAYYLPLPGFEVTGHEFELLKRYVGYLGDERVLLANYEVEPTSFIVDGAGRARQKRRTSDEERRTRPPLLYFRGQSKTIERSVKGNTDVVREPHVTSSKPKAALTGVRRG